MIHICERTVEHRCVTLLIRDLQPARVWPKISLVCWLGKLRGQGTTKSSVKCELMRGVKLRGMSEYVSSKSTVNSIDISASHEDSKTSEGTKRYFLKSLFLFI